MDQLIYFVHVYVPTLEAPDDTKEDFFSQLDTFITRFPQQEDLVILVDFNAGVGSDLEAWPNCLGHFGVGKCKEKRPAAARTLLLPNAFHYQYILWCQTTLQSVL